MRGILGLTALLLLAPVAAEAACTVSATGVVFGAYNPNVGTPANATGTVSLSCTAGSSSSGAYTIGLSMGGGASYSTRRLSTGLSTLSYQLYQDSAHTIIWGDGTGSSVIFNGNDGLPNSGGTNNLSIYGQIPARQGVTPGVYTDVIVVTVTY